MKKKTKSNNSKSGSQSTFDIKLSIKWYKPKRAKIIRRTTDLVFKCWPYKDIKSNEV